MKPEITILNIFSARKLIKSHVLKTPLRFSHYYSTQSNAEIYLKLENLQLTGSFKLRGALNTMLSLPSEQKNKGVITASAGNHAQGIGFAAKLLNIPAIIYVPENAPLTKIEAIKSYGVSLKIKGSIYDDTERIAIEDSRVKDIPYISPYNNPHVIAGQGTIGLEILEQAPDVDDILIPISGGGLFSGIAIAAKAINPSIRCYGVQVERCPVMLESLKQGQIVDVPMEETIADGLHGGVEKGSITFPYIQRLCEEVLLVSEREIKKAILEFMEYHHLICEGAGAVGLAAVKRYREKFVNRKVAIVISGANIDLRTIKECFEILEPDDL